MVRIPEPTQVMYELTFAIRKAKDKETGLYESVCIQLGTASVGNTIDEALHNIYEATDLELETFQTSTELISYLRRHGAKVWTDGDVFREMDRLNLEVQSGTIATTERFTRKLVAC